MMMIWAVVSHAPSGSTRFTLTAAAALLSVWCCPSYVNAKQQADSLNARGSLLTTATRLRLKGGGGGGINFIQFFIWTGGTKTFLVSINPVNPVNPNLYFPLAESSDLCICNCLGLFIKLQHQHHYHHHEVVVKKRATTTRKRRRDKLPVIRATCYYSTC